MRGARVVLCPVVVAVALLWPPGTSLGQELPTPTCAWQFAWSPTGLGNWLFPDTGNRWWYMPIDPKWQEVTVIGTYPKTRFFSLAAYDGAPVSTGLADRLFDAQIVPDPGSLNPFEDPSAQAAQQPRKYTVTITRKDSSAGNTLRLHADTGRADGAPARRERQAAERL